MDGATNCSDDGANQDDNADDNSKTKTDSESDVLTTAPLRRYLVLYLYLSSISP